ncbi:MAG TPA: hypothetical protein VFT85_06765 [Acidimicrobiia bacterium]|nr:hypothetical protein [Acidimicrobiia bacterium]
MTHFDARLRLPGHTRIPVSVVVDISGDRLKFDQGDTALASWPLDGVAVEARSDGFHLKFEEEEVILNVEDAQRFAGELARAQKTPPPILAEATSEQPQRRENMFERLNGVDPEELFASVKARITELREALVDPDVEPDVVFARWIRLLREINLRHGQGAMPTPLFYRLNTELLDLLPVPSVARDSTESLAVS